MLAVWCLVFAAVGERFAVSGKRDTGRGRKHPFHFQVYPCPMYTIPNFCICNHFFLCRLVYNSVCGGSAQLEIVASVPIT